MIQTRISETSSTGILPVTRWSKPPTNFLKCNVDVAVFNHPSRMRYGCIIRIRNDPGAILTAIHGAYLGNFRPTLAEVLSFRVVFSLIEELNFSNILVESDTFDYHECS